MKTLVGNIKKAAIEMLILKLLSEEDMYGYQMTQEFRKRSNGFFSVLEGSMYPILYRLTDSGCISSYEKKIGVRQTRIYYHLEPPGETYKQEMIANFRKNIQVVEFLLSSKQGDCYEQNT